MLTLARAPPEDEKEKQQRLMRVRRVVSIRSGLRLALLKPAALPVTPLPDPPLSLLLLFSLDYKGLQPGMAGCSTYRYQQINQLKRSTAALINAAVAVVKEKKRKDSAGSDETASMIKGGGYLGARTMQPTIKNN